MDLGSIVYSPSAYYGGIQAIMLNAYQYTPINCFKADVTKDQKRSDYKDTDAPNSRTFVPNVVMNYYLNPKSAFIDTDASKFEFVATDAAYTRAFSGSDLVVKKVSQEKIGGKPTGLFTVVARVNNAEKIQIINQDPKKDSQVTVAALRYADGDTAVISDFAALKRQMNTNFSVCYANGVELFGDQDKARDEEYPVLSFERGKSLDLTKEFKAYYHPNNSTDAVEFRASDMNNAGFKLKYELIGYLTKDKDAKYTNQSERCEITSEDELKLKDAKPGDEGRTPLIRVMLVDTNNDDAVAAVGYVKVAITEAIADPIVLTEPVDWKANYTLVCGNEIFKTFGMSWKQMENDVLNKAEVNLSKADFEKIYELKVDASGEAIQYKLNKGAFTEVSSSEKFGTVKFTNSGRDDEMTNVLQWTILNGEAYLAAKNKSVATKQVIVAWTPKTNVAGYKSRGIIYATLQWTIGERNIEPKASIKNEEDKTYALWAKNYAYAKAGVNSNCDFNVTTTSSFNKDPYSIVKERLGSYSSLLTGMNYKFMSAQAENYVLYVEDNKVKCQNETIVSIGGDGKTLTYADNALAKEILNSAEEPLTVNIKMIPTSCKPAEGVIELDNDEYAMKYIRPMSITENKAENIVDRAEEIKYSKVTLEFKNWLNEKVVYAKYGMVGADVLVQNPNEDVTSNFNKGGKNFEKVPNGLKISYDGSTFDPATGNYGRISYLRSESLVVVQDFQVRVPILVNYKWGQIPVTLEFTVKKTK